MIELGKRVQAGRENILEMNQSELAEKINTSQVLLSRIERGIGATLMWYSILLIIYIPEKLLPKKSLESDFHLT